LKGNRVRGCGKPGIVLIQLKLDNSASQLKDFFWLSQILTLPLAGLFYQLFKGITKL